MNAESPTTSEGRALKENHVVTAWCVCHAFPNPHRHDSATGQIIHEIVMRAERRVVPPALEGKE